MKRCISHNSWWHVFPLCYFVIFNNINVNIYFMIDNAILLEIKVHLLYFIKPHIMFVVCVFTFGLFSLVFKVLRGLVCKESESIFNTSDAKAWPDAIIFTACNFFIFFKLTSRIISERITLAYIWTQLPESRIDFIQCSWVLSLCYASFLFFNNFLVVNGTFVVYTDGKYTLYSV